MKDRFRFVPPLVLATSLTGCDLAGDLIEFGFWMGLIAVIVLALLIWAVIQLFD